MLVKIAIVEYLWLLIGLVGIITSLVLGVLARKERREVIETGSGYAWQLIAEAHVWRESLRFVVQSMFFTVGVLSVTNANNNPDVDVSSQRFFLIVLLVMAQFIIVLGSLLDLHYKRAVRNYLNESA